MSRPTRRAFGAAASIFWLGASGLSSAVAQAPGIPAPATMRGTINIRGRSIAYRGVASEIVLPNAAGGPGTTIFSAAYLEEGADPAKRPVTFLFNGGPGGATIALREGLGPRITVNADSADGFAFVDNPHSLLDQSDLVFVDPPGVGYSRFLTPGSEREFWGVEEDARAVAAFIRAWLAENGRTASPKFLVGESYAGVRVGFVTELLAQGAQPIKMNGVVLVSPSTSTRGRAPLAGPADPAVRALPSQAAAAWFHKKGAYGDRTVEAVAADAHRFASGPYTQALAKGTSLPPAEASKIAAQVAAFTGFSVETVQAGGLKVPGDRFVRELLSDTGERIGGSDARAKAPRSITDTRKAPYDDPSTSPYTLKYDLTKAVEGLFQNEFGYRPASGYIRLSYPANEQWNHKVARGSVAMPLMFKDLMARDPGLKVTLMLGYYDLTIPYAGPLEEYLAADLPKGRFTHRVYPAGHAVFSDAASRSQATDDLRAFYRAALG
jgi:carboxypeptidase C (cathepsin A)